MKRSSRIKFYRKVRTALLATNKRTDNSIITECNIVMPLANDKGMMARVNEVRSRRLVRVKKITNKKIFFDNESK